MKIFNYYLYQIIVKFFLFILYFSVISDGAKTLIPILGKPLSKTPFLGLLRQYEGFDKLTFAHIFAIALFGLVWMAWGYVFDFYLKNEGYELAVTILFPLAVILLLADGIMFYRGMSELAWGATDFSFPTFVASIAYIGILILAVLFNSLLKPKETVS